MEHLNVPNSYEHRSLAQGYAAQYMREISCLLLRMPRPMLLLLKTNDCLRSVDAALGQPVNTFVITARCVGGGWGWGGPTHMVCGCV